MCGMNWCLRLCNCSGNWIMLCNMNCVIDVGDEYG